MKKILFFLLLFFVIYGANNAETRQKKPTQRKTMYQKLTTIPSKKEAREFWYGNPEVIKIKKKKVKNHWPQ